MTMTHDEKVAFVDELYATTAAGDWEKAASMLTDDFVASEAPGLPMAGDFKGKNGLKELYLKVFSLVDAAGLSRTVTTTGGDYAVTILEIQYADPSIPPSEICEVFKFRDGKCCMIKPYYFDPKSINDAAAAKAAG
ncbi:nuclear transport factor 2 family protein [Erythrobacter sp. SCSIO 43205]|uniref:nuclear transport factor 2 family protein n=1 Tax=Erythrobacter sp. SCSIO 43205 TaxID=2779361 RepID=UPI00351D8CFD